MSDYSKSIVYKIHKDDICYIGSSNDETLRKRNHKSDCNNENAHNYNTPVYKYIRENGGWDTWEFEVIERFSCKNEEQLVEREDYYYDLLKPVLNTRRPLRTKEELKEQKAINGVKWYKVNKEAIAKKNAENAEERNKYNAEYLQKNKVKLYQKFICDCGGKYTHQSKSRHLKLNIHIAFIEKKAT